MAGAAGGAKGHGRSVRRQHLQREPREIGGAAGAQQRLRLQALEARVGVVFAWSCCVELPEDLENMLVDHEATFKGDLEAFLAHKADLDQMADQMAERIEAAAAERVTVETERAEAAETAKAAAEAERAKVEAEAAALRQELELLIDGQRRSARAATAVAASAVLAISAAITLRRNRRRGRGSWLEWLMHS